MTLLLEGLGWLLALTGTVLSWFGLPGPLLFILGLIVWGGTPSIVWPGIYQLLTLLVVLILAEMAEQLGGFLGMSWSGIRRSGWMGAIAGAIVGLVLVGILWNPLIIVVGLLSGAWLGEVVGGKPPLEALKVAAGFGMGKFGGYLIKNTLVTGLLFYLVIFRVWSLLMAG